MFPKFYFSTKNSATVLPFNFQYNRYKMKPLKKVYTGWNVMRPGYGIHNKKYVSKHIISLQNYLNYQSFCVKLFPYICIHIYKLS